MSKLIDKISQLHSTNEKIISELAVVKNVNSKLEEWIISLEKKEAKSEQYSCCNNIELSGIQSDIPENNLEKVVRDDEQYHQKLKHSCNFDKKTKIKNNFFVNKTIYLAYKCKKPFSK